MATSNNQPTRVLVISNDERVIIVIKAAISREQDFVLPGHLSLSEGYIDAAQVLKPGIIILDYLYDQKNIYKIIDELAGEFPHCPIIVVIPKEELHQSNQIILAGARAFIPQPFSQIDLISTLRRVRELHTRTPIISSVDGEMNTNQGMGIFVVYSPKGGVGCTTVATNLAIALQKEIGEDVLLMDGKHQFGHVALLLNIVTKNSIIDLIPYASTLDTALINQVVVRHSSGLQVLPSPSVITEAQGIVPNDLYKIILALQQAYPSIVVDGGSSITENTVTYLDSALRILLVITPNLASLRDAYQFLGICRTLSYPNEKILPIVNQLGRKQDIKLEEIEKALQMSIFGTIPVDDDDMVKSMNDGTPIIVRKPSHTISKAYKRIASRLTKLSIQPKPTNKVIEEKSTNDVLVKTARLG